MRTPLSMRALEDLGRVRLSPNFFLRDFLFSEIANFYGIPNIPTDPDLAISVGKLLCEHLLEPLQRTFGRLSPMITGARIIETLGAFTDSLVQAGRQEKALDILVRVQTHVEGLTKILAVTLWGDDKKAP